MNSVIKYAPADTNVLCRYGWALYVVSFACFAAGCGRYARTERIFYSPYPKAYSIAIVPFRNLSGTESVDVMAVTDEFYAELQQVHSPVNHPYLNLQVMPVNRVLSALSELKLNNVVSPDTTLMLADHLGVDAVIVGAITRYDPYPPPKLGMSLQLFVRDEPAKKNNNTGSFNPGDLARAGSPIELPAGPAIKPRSQVIRIFDASQEQVIRQIKEYAHSRGADKKPYGWKEFTTSRNYIRFVCHQMIGELLAREKHRLGMQTSAVKPG